MKASCSPAAPTIPWSPFEALHGALRLLDPDRDFSFVIRAGSVSVRQRLPLNLNLAATKGLEIKVPTPMGLRYDF
jgi:hypothetical protein